MRKILAGVIAELRTDGATKKTKLASLKAVVEHLNAYNDQQGCFIETPEREALLACLEDLVAVSGLGPLEEQLDEWRDW